MKKIVLISNIILSILILPIYSQNFFNFMNNGVKTWDADPPEIQLQKEGTLLPKNLGGLFIPTMSSSNIEPGFKIFSLKDNKKKLLYDNAKTFKTYILPPGEYLVQTGSGELQITQKIKIKKEEYSILMPNWGAISFKVQDENRNFIRENFDIFILSSDIPQKVLTISSEDFENLDKISTYYLPAGVYKLVKSGSNINTEIDFSTFTILPGHYLPYMIVLDNTSRHFLASGIIRQEYTERKVKNWRLFGGIHGNFNLSNSNDLSSKQNNTNYSFSTQLEFTAKYDNRLYYFYTRNNFEEGWNKQGSESIRTFIDNMETKNIFVLKIYKPFGIYSRLNLTTKIFASYKYYDSPTNITVYQKDSTKYNIFPYKEKVRISPPFFPLDIKEGIGLNFTFSPSIKYTFNIRTGFGFRQTYNNDVLSLIDEKKDSVYKQLSNSQLTGYELSYFSQIYPFNNVYIITEFDMIYPFSAGKKRAYELENIINLRLLNNISLDYTIRIKQDKNISNIIKKEQIILIRYSYYFF